MDFNITFFYLIRQEELELEFALKWILTFSACVDGAPLEIRLGDEHHGNKVTLT